jgi:hypothetical protein
MLVGNPPCEGVELHDTALNDAMATDIAGLPGVHEAHVQLTGHAQRPSATIDLTLNPDARPREVLHALETGPLRRARQSTEWEQLPAQATLRVTSQRPRRVE